MYHGACRSDGAHVGTMEPADLMGARGYYGACRSDGVRVGTMEPADLRARVGTMEPADLMGHARVLWNLQI